MKILPLFPSPYLPISLPVPTPPPFLRLMSCLSLTSGLGSNRILQNCSCCGPCLSRGRAVDRWDPVDFYLVQDGKQPNLVISCSQVWADSLSWTCCWLFRSRDSLSPSSVYAQSLEAAVSAPHCLGISRPCCTAAPA